MLTRVNETRQVYSTSVSYYSYKRGGEYTLFCVLFIGAYLRSVLPEFESIDPFRDHTCKILFDHLGMQIKLCEGRGKQAVNL